MKRIPSLLIGAGLLAMAQSAFAGAEIYIGRTTATNELNYEFEGDDFKREMEPGMVFGGGYYFEQTPNFEWGADVMTTSQGYGTEPDSSISTTSLSLAGRYIVDMNSAVDLYFGGGVGGAHLNWQTINVFGETINDDAFGAVGHVEMGIRYPMQDVTWFTGLKYQTGFNDFEMDDSSAEYNSLSLIGGISF